MTAECDCDRVRGTVFSPEEAVDGSDPVVVDDVVKGTGAEASEGDLAELVKGRLRPVREERFEIVPRTKLERDVDVEDVVDIGERVELESETHVDEADPRRDSEEEEFGEEEEDEEDEEGDKR
ncbi:hypothetical protein BG005_005803 [Podila minutissima]|nr:hypothetical protein BG005_005803 [Podila minutissima]